LDFCADLTSISDVKGVSLPFVGRFRNIFLFWLLLTTPLFAQEGYWRITQLSISNALMPVINNSGEIVWCMNLDGGVFSSTRGKLADSGLYPHLANSGEVVYAGSFDNTNWDLVSTTRGRLTYGGTIGNVDLSTFDVNATGEVVYEITDTNNFQQIYSTVRGQITSGPADHFHPCINDTGEIIWSQYTNGSTAVVSSTRGVFAENGGWLLDLNNAGDFIFWGQLESPPGQYSSPHLFSSKHGVIINDTNQFQWSGGLNDAGTIVWNAPVEPGSSTWYFYKADWILLDTTPPQIKRITANRNILWPADGRMIPVKLNVRAVDNMDAAPVCRITQVLCNEPLNSGAPAWVITGALSLNLRAARNGTRLGRIYTIVVECSDKSGNVSSSSVDVVVPRRYSRGWIY
jgi:hypothetical protein